MSGPTKSPTARPVRLDLHPDLRAHFGDDDDVAFDRIIDLDGRVYRELDNRRTLRFELGGESYFLKAHLGASWSEILKNWLSFRRPILGAGVERRAIAHFEALGLESTPVVGYGERGSGLTTSQSILITRELTNTESLEDYCRDWPTQAPSPRLRHAITNELGRILRLMHDSGVQHRDCYACHFLLDLATAEPVDGETRPRLFVIDLHRAEVKPSITETARLKDIAALYFSCLDFGITRADVLRFIAAYRQEPPPTPLRYESSFWTRIRERAERLYRKVHEREPPRVL